MDRMEWLRRRKLGVSGTDIAAIMGLHPYKSAMKLWIEKRQPVDEVDDVDDVSNQYMEWGNRLERPVADKWSEKHGKIVSKGLFIEKIFSGVILCGTPDFIVLDANQGLEIKTAGSRSAFKWGNGPTDIPMEYYLQCQWYLMLTGFDIWHMAVLIGGNEYKDYVIQRNEKIINVAQDKAMKFWKEHVLTGEPPEDFKSSDYGTLLGQTVALTVPELLPAPNEAFPIVEALIEVKNDLAELEVQKTAMENRLKALIGENKGFLGSDWKCTWSEVKGRKSVDYDGLLKAKNITLSDLEPFTKVGKPGRMFKLTTIGES